MESKPVFIEILSPEIFPKKRRGEESLPVELCLFIEKNSINFNFHTALSKEREESPFQAEEILDILNDLRDDQKDREITNRQIVEHLNQHFIDWIYEIFEEQEKGEKGRREPLLESSLDKLFGQSMFILERFEQYLDEEKEVQKQLIASTHPESTQFDQALKSSIERIKGYLPEEGFSHWPPHLQQIYCSEYFSKRVIALSEGLSENLSSKRNGELLGEKLKELIRDYQKKRRELGATGKLELEEVMMFFEMLLLSSETSNIGFFLHQIVLSEMDSSASLYFVKMLREVSFSFL